jgi:hypothetical protein
VAVVHHFEPARLCFVPHPDWSAWHPRQWPDEATWSGLAPMIYLQRGSDPSFVIPIDWEYFLAWRLPAGDKPLPFLPAEWTVKYIEPLRGRPDWTVIRADLDPDCTDWAEESKSA